MGRWYVGVLKRCSQPAEGVRTIFARHCNLEREGICYAQVCSECGATATTARPRESRGR